MTNYNLVELIIRYERARARVQALKTQRRELLALCKAQSGSDRVCTQKAYTALQTKLTPAELNAQWDFIHPDLRQREAYEDELFNGPYCDHCQQAYRIKTQVLPDANEHLGNMKRTLSSVGKRLIAAQNTRQPTAATLRQGLPMNA